MSLVGRTLVLPPLRAGGGASTLFANGIGIRAETFRCIPISKWRRATCSDGWKSPSGSAAVSRDHQPRRLLLLLLWPEKRLAEDAAANVLEAASVVEPR